MKVNQLDWSKLYFGKVSPSEVQQAIKNDEWQETRLKMKGMSLSDKYSTLNSYYHKAMKEAKSEYSKRLVKVRVTNYVTALSRGGLINPSDYKKEGEK